ncbi:hypothetical protein TWF192_001350 [Orbilia oligospora]|uniref:Uncharacterized protein n=1 Tax=Orbilia oligospora TaxID=2813651 RepID=A0A6G1MGF8_ORBOL|nr:hypothetical protein TWF679_010116 [Orbilia oligospora]KAF3220902.1 hypothetical protein TWF191_007360 [Orbilia oligospora]KAF3257068.1 hypothetical protein TWF192_001350 [Orbilia oligospora]
MSPNFNSIFYDSAVSSPTEPQLTSPDGSIDPKGGLSYISVYSTVMVFNPDFNFGNIIKRSSTGPINGNFTSWFESDGESSPVRNTPLAKIEEIPLSPKSKPKSILTCDLEGKLADLNKVYSESNESRIGTALLRPKSNRKVNPKKQSPHKIEVTVPANGKSGQRLDRRCMLDRSDAQYNSILLSESQDEDQAGSCRSREGSDWGLDDRDTDYQKLILNSTASLPYSSSNSSSSTIKPIETPASIVTPVPPVVEEPSNRNLRIFRPKLQLRTAISNPTFRTTPVLIAPASSERRNSKEKGLTQSKGPRATSSHSAVSRAASPERNTTETPQQSRTKLPLHSLLLSPLGAVARSRSRSTSRGRIPSIALSISNSINIGNNNNRLSNSTARSSSVSVGPSQEIDEADEVVAELSDMVSHGQVVGSAKEQQPSGSSRSVSRFRRFSLAYLSGSEHDYDGGSEQSSRSPLRSWKSWSNRSSIASFSSANNRHSRARYSAASISTSQGSSLSSSSTSALDHHTHPETGVHVDDRRRPSLSGSSVAELPWRQVPPQTYAHLMSSRRNSVATPTVTHHWQYSQTLTQTFTAAKAPSPNLTAATSRSSDGSSIHSLVERVYSAQPTPVTEGEDPFVAFYMATKPKTSPLEIQAEEIRAYEKQQKQEKLLQRIANGSFFDSDDESDNEDEGSGLLDSDEDLFGHSAAHDWWMSGIEEAPEEDEEWEIPRVPSLEFDTRSQQRESSISTGTTLTTDDLHPSTPTAAEIAHYRKITELAMTEPPEKRRRRRRTASSECLIVEAVEGLRTMYLEEPSDDCAVEEEDDIMGTKTPQSQELPLSPVKPLSLLPESERASRRISMS